MALRPECIRVLSLCHRIDRLRALGNGVVVEQGAVAFAMLARRLTGNVDAT